jgi:hypothetical protein
MEWLLAEVHLQDLLQVPQLLVPVELLPGRLAVLVEQHSEPLRHLVLLWLPESVPVEWLVELLAVPLVLLVELLVLLPEQFVEGGCPDSRQVLLLP